MSDPYITEKELCARWGVCRRTLWLYRKNKTGPKYSKLKGSIRYLLADIIAFEKQSGLSSETITLFDADISKPVWVQYTNLRISMVFLYMTLISLVNTIKTINLSNSEYLLYKELVVLFRDTLSANIPSMRDTLSKMCDSI